MFDLHMYVHDILDNAMSKEVSNTVHILVYLFNSASRQCCEFWALQYPIFTI